MVGERKKVSVVCPFFNEAAVIRDSARNMIAALEARFPGAWELILVDDGSTDASLDVLLEVLRPADAECVRVLSFPWNQGRGRALKEGIDAASGAIIVTTEIDGSWGPDIVGRLVEELDAHRQAHVVVASPHLPGGGFANVPLRRVLLSRYGNRLIRLFFDSKVTMTTGMTRGYRAEVIQPLLVHENRKEFHLEVLLKLITLRFNVCEIPAVISWPPAGKGKQRKGARKSSTRIFRTIGTHLKFVAIAQPVRYFAWLSGGSLVMGAGFMSAAVWMLLTGGPSVFLALIALLMLIFCLMFAGFAVLFFQFRELMREQWMQCFGTRLPPSVARGVPVFPAPDGGTE